MKKAVITSDIVQSGKLSLEQREWVLLQIQEKLTSLTKSTLGIESGLKSELYRGDSFQCILDPAYGLRMTLLMKTFMKGLITALPHTRTTKILPKLDIRISLGIGDISYNAPKLNISDGEAFHISGRKLDELKKQKMTFVISSDDSNNEELESSAVLLDFILAKTTSLQCQVLSMKLEGYKEIQIAETLNIKQSAINQRAISGGWHPIEVFLKRFEKIYANGH